MVEGLMASVLDLCIVLHATSRDFMVLIFFIRVQLLMLINVLQ